MNLIVPHIDQESVIDYLREETNKLQKYIGHTAGKVNALRLTPYFNNIRLLLDSWSFLSRPKEEAAITQETDTPANFFDYIFTTFDDANLQEANQHFEDMGRYKITTVQKFVSLEHEKGNENWFAFVEAVTGKPIVSYMRVYPSNIVNYIHEECCKNYLLRSGDVNTIITRMQRLREIRQNK